MLPFAHWNMPSAQLNDAPPEGLVYPGYAAHAFPTGSDVQVLERQRRAVRLDERAPRLHLPVIRQSIHISSHR